MFNQSSFVVQFIFRVAFTFAWIVMGGGWLYASGGVGTTGAAFLDIPSGAEPAAMGSAYSALATNGYATTWNPGGLGFLESTDIAGQHLSYVEGIHYESLGIAHPLTAHWGVGASLQYFGSGDISGSDASGTSTGDFSSFYSAMTLGAGRRFGQRLSVGVSGKWIHGDLNGIQANAMALDTGLLARLSQAWDGALVFSNVGTDLRFREQSDPLPLAFKTGVAWHGLPTWTFSMENVWRARGPDSWHGGISWWATRFAELRVGYRTDTRDGLSALAGLSLGMGLRLGRQELSYAWRPLGDLGNTHYVSFHLHLGESPAERRNLIRYGPPPLRMVETSDPWAYDERTLMNLLNQGQPSVVETPHEDKAQ